MSQNVLEIPKIIFCEFKAVMVGCLGAIHYFGNIMHYVITGLKTGTETLVGVVSGNYL